MIIGISGKKGHGKNAAAEQIAHAVPRTHTCALADAIKRIAMETYHLTFAQCFGTIEDKERVDPRWGKSPREILQRIGTEMGREIHPDTWIRKLQDDIEALRGGREWRRVGEYRWELRPIAGSTPLHFVVPDIRFPNEAAWIQGAGGPLFNIQRPGVDTGVYNAHSSETGIDALPYDKRIVNDGTFADLGRKVVGALLFIEETAAAGTARH